MARIINQGMLIEKRPSLSLITASLISPPAQPVYVTFEVNAILQFERRGIHEMRVYVRTFSRDRDLNELIIGGQYESTMGPLVKIAGVIYLDNSEPSYLYFVDETRLHLTKGIEEIAPRSGDASRNYNMVR